MTVSAGILRLGALACAVVLGGCSLLGGDAGRYRTCDDEAGMGAWQRARASLARMDDRAALDDLRVAVVRCPDLIPAHVAYQDAAMRIGGETEREMKDFYVELARRGRPSPVPAYMRARLDETAYAQSNALDGILAEYPEFAWGYLSRGRVHRGQGRLVEALRNFERALERDPALHVARLERAQVLADLGRNEEAAVQYRAYLEHNPDDHDADREYIALLLYKLLRIDEALARIRALEQKGDRSLSLRMDYAATMWQARRHREAVDVYLDVLREDATMARAALNIGLIYYEVVPGDEAERRRFWPAARAAFAYFLAHCQATDGHESYERSFGVPYRLRRIEELLGPGDARPPDVDRLAWPER